MEFGPSFFGFFSDPEIEEKLTGSRYNINNNILYIYIYTHIIHGTGISTCFTKLRVSLPNWRVHKLLPWWNFSNFITDVHHEGAQVCGQSIAKSLLRYKSLPRAGTRRKRRNLQDGQVKRSAERDRKEGNILPIPENNHFRPWKWMVGRWLSFKRRPYFQGQTCC